MIENIELIGLNNEIIKKIEEKLGYDTLLNMACNYENVKKNIDLLRLYNINVIDELLIYRNDVFLYDSNFLTEKFSKFDIPVFASLVNSDYTMIDEVFNS